jgi:D-inositol-3-phosphate glycosyltransferase
MTTLRDPIAMVMWHTSPLGAPGNGQVGGMTVYVRELARALGDAGNSVDIFARREGGHDQAVQISPTVRVLHLADPGAAGLNEVTAKGVDLPSRYVAIHSHYWRSFGVARALLEPLGVRWHVHTHHSLATPRNETAAAADSCREQIETEAKDAGAFVVSTQHERDLLAGDQPADADIRVVSPGVDHALFRPASPRRSTVTSEVVCVGRLDPAKGLDLAIQGFATATKRSENPMRLRIVGGDEADHEGAEIHRLRQLAEAAGVASDVSFHLAVSHADLADVYRRADALLVCSQRESFGLAMIEAQACGVPVVGTAVGILPELARQGGAILVPRVARGIADGIAAALEPDRAPMLREAAVRTARHYSWGRMATEMLKVYSGPTAR